MDRFKPETWTALDRLAVAGFVLTYMAIVLGFLLVGVPYLTSDKRKKLVGWICIACAIAMVPIGVLLWHFIDTNQWPAILSYWGPTINLACFITYVCFLYGYYTARRRILRCNAEDRAWSAHPFALVKAVAFKCDIHLGTRALAVQIDTRNDYGKSRHVWITACVAIYQGGVGTPRSPLVTVALPVITGTIAANRTETIKLKQPIALDSAQAELLKRIYDRDRVLTVLFVDATLSTLIDLSNDPKIAIDKDVALPPTRADVHE